MKAAIRSIVPICVIAGALLLRVEPTRSDPRGGLVFDPNCGGPTWTGAQVEGARVAWSCAPPYTIPVYPTPPDDSVALSSLLEAAGYPSAANTEWLGVAAGNFCGGPEKQLVLAQNQAPNFSILHGPTPYWRHIGGTASLTSASSHPWRAVVAGNLDGSAQDAIVALRKVTAAGAPDLIVAKIEACSCSVLDEVTGRCEVPTVVASTTIGSPSNSDWVGAAVGNFDGNGKKIALLKAHHSNLFVVQLTQNTLNVVHTDDLDSDPSQPSQWKALAAGDIDGDGIDELIAVREVSDGLSPTVLAFKWDTRHSAFRLYATSTIGNDGNSKWSGAAIGDFNADGRNAIVLVKNEHSNFIVLDLPPGATELRTLSWADLDSTNGQPWTGLAAIDWLSGDQGASELIAVRAVRYPYRTNVFVYGNAFHRVSRDTALDGTKAQYLNNMPNDFNPADSVKPEDLKNWLRGTHTNTMVWVLKARGDYPNLVEFLQATKNWGVDGKQLRVWVGLVPLSDKGGGAPNWGCSLPEATPHDTSWSVLDFFNLPPNPTEDDLIGACNKTLAWASAVGRLAQDFPHLVGLTVDDFSDFIEPGENKFPPKFQPDGIAEIQSRMRAQSSWLNFAPFIYHNHPANEGPHWPDFWADMGPALDSVVFFFRNDKRDGPGRHCVNNTLECERTVNNAPDEIADISQLLPKGRKLLLGIYFVGLFSGSDGTPPTIRYDYDLARVAVNLHTVAGAVAYGLQIPLWICPFCVPCTGAQCVAHCTDFNFLDPANPSLPIILQGTDRYCALQKAYGGKPQYVTHTDLTPTGPLTDSDPSAYFAEAEGIHHVIYRSGNGHLHELWWSGGAAPGQGDLTARAGGAPLAMGDPAAYFADGTHHVIYRSGNGHLHELWWSGGAAPGQGDLTINAGGAPLAMGDPAAYFADGTHHVIYRSGNGHLHELWWSGGAAPGQGDLTVNAGGAPLAMGDPAAYFADGTHHVIYRSGDGHLHELWWSGGGAVGHGDLTDLTHTPLAESNPSAYFVTADGRHHVIYRSQDGHIHELWWTVGIVTHNDLTALANAAMAKGNPSDYFSAGAGNHQVIYRGGDDHVHELRWTN